MAVGIAVFIISLFVGPMVDSYYRHVPTVVTILEASIAPIGVLLIVIGAVRDSRYRRRHDRRPSDSN